METSNKSIKPPRHNTLSIIALIMAIIQAPLFYYYTTGLLSIFQIGFYLIVGLGFTIYLFSLLIKKEGTPLTKAFKYRLWVTFFIGAISFFYGPMFMEKADWTLRRSSREEIIMKIKKGEIRDSKLDGWNFPPISNGGNEIEISKRKKGLLTVMFYIDRGFIDHCSAFVYTNDANELKDIKSWYSSVEQLDKNWYRVSK
ncbi:hypothetical protein [Parabacteroides sp. FAFU027]|uniref:hypothetical protein n=1 Tax=Parabacteroides sp. FAFU027 TaxID=2922715 RepID=UPI001FB03554|nr:hypothetical protein [Parabacteroides sp. FAFU027]